MNQTTASDDTERTTEDQKYPFGLSSTVLFILIVLMGLIMPGLLVTLLERTNLSVLADIVWVFGYGTTIFSVWYIWIRPLNLVGPSKQETTRTEPDARTNEISENTGTDTADPAGNEQTADSHDQNPDSREVTTDTEQRSPE